MSFIYSMPEKETIRIAKLKPTNDCPDLIDTSPSLDNLTYTKFETGCLTCLCLFIFYLKLDL